MDTANNTYTFGMATGEIVSLLLLTFLVGMLLCWLLRQTGLCCRTRKTPTPLPSGKYHTRDFDINTTNANAKLAVPDVYVPKVKVQPRLVDLPDLDLPKPSVDSPTIKVVDMPTAVLDIPETDIIDIDVEPPEVVLDLPEVELPKAALTLPEVELPEAELYIPEPEITQPNWLTAIDPHKPIIDPPDLTVDTDLDMPIMQTSSLPITAANSIELPEIDPLLVAIDPHKPIVDPPDMEWEISQEALTMQNEPLRVDLEVPPHDPLLAAIDPHKPIIDPPDMPEETPTTGSLFNSWLHKAKESVEHLTEKATPATSDWLHKAKESVEHLTEKATPTTSEWLHKAKESVEHLTEKATPATSEWLHKAKEIGNELSAKSSSLTSAETLAKGGSTLAALAASAKELTEKLASNLSTKHDDLQKLVGIGPTFASVLHRAGIHTYEQLSETSPQKLQALLIVEDEQFSKHDTSSWPRQAALAAYGEWEQLKAYQDTLSV